MSSFCIVCCYSTAPIFEVSTILQFLILSTVSPMSYTWI